MDHEVERKVVAILKALNEAGKPLGSTEVARRLKQSGIDLSERAVRYHFGMLDERGLTSPGGRDGRTLTQKGKEELRNALVTDKVGFVIARIETLAFQTTFDWKKREGLVPMNVSFFQKNSFRRSIQLMKPVFQAGLCVSEKVFIADEGERIGPAMVPPGKVGFATMCTIVFNGCLLKAGIPMESKFGGIVQLNNNKPMRFVDLIYYSGSSLDPSEAFIRSRMTDVRGVLKSGNGKLLANFREIPAAAKPVAEEVIQGLRECGFDGVLAVGDIGEPVCEVPVEFNRIGMVMLGGLTPVAAVQEAGIDVDNHAMSIVLDYNQLVSFNRVQ
ncbi:MAG: DUF128 domain-containing protein [Chloroflexi bacterium]|nr:DUF128 domain-containing protein [Chloroflexota bacterium]